MAVVVAKIARSEWPDEWPTLIPQLLQAVQTNEGLARMRALMFLHGTIKELSARVVGPTRKHLAEAAPPLFSFLFSLWKEARLHALTDFKAAQVERYCVKILRRLVCHAFSRIDHNRCLGARKRGRWGGRGGGARELAGYAIDTRMCVRACVRVGEHGLSPLLPSPAALLPRCVYLPFSAGGLCMLVVLEQTRAMQRLAALLQPSIRSNLN